MWTIQMKEKYVDFVERDIQKLHLRKRLMRYQN